MHALMAAMNNPHLAIPSVHVAGTNGKGSTSSMLAAIATASGRRVGLHTSPHLTHITERMRLDGVPAPEAWLDDAVARYRDIFEAVQPSFFEATTALSLLYFAQEKADLTVVEVGLGGRLDATNVIMPLLSIITTIGLEHTDLLGDTLAAIAREKAGIIKPGVPVLTAVAQPEALEAIRVVAEAQDAPLHQIADEVHIHTTQTSLVGQMMDIRTPVRTYEGLQVGVPGQHQQMNASLALRAAELLFDEERQDTQAIYTGLREVRRLAGLRGRLDVLQTQPLIVADVGHNPDGLATALAFIQQHRPSQQGGLYVIFGAMRDKDIAAMVRLLREAKATVLPVSAGGERALPAVDLAVILRQEGNAVIEQQDVAAGWSWFQHQAAEDDMLLITGSHQVVAQVPGVG